VRQAAAVRQPPVQERQGPQAVLSARMLRSRSRQVRAARRHSHAASDGRAQRHQLVLLPREPLPLLLVLEAAVVVVVLRPVPEELSALLQPQRRLSAPALPR
jgi:hypothetical protein